MKHSLIILIAFIILVSTRCDSTDIISLPTQEPKLVVNSIGYSGYRWAARVSASQDVLNLAMFRNVNDATVNIYENGALAETLIYEDYDYPADESAEGTLYLGSATVPKPGSIYKITVGAPGYTSAESEFQQPDSVSVQSLTVTQLGPHPECNMCIGVSVNVEFTDPPGETFYEIIGIANWINDNGTISAAAHLNLEFVDPAYRENNGVFYQTLAFDDTFFDGKTVNFEFDGMHMNDRNYRHYSIYLRVLSKEYYQYLKTTNLQRNAESDPFAQPVLISNNIVNGYGVFGGFSEAKKTYVIPNE